MDELTTSPAPEQQPAGQGADAAQGAELYAFPASITQRRFWVLDQLEPGNPAFNIAVRFRLKGHLNSAILERAFNEMVRRHEILRTSFTLQNDQLVQLVVPSLAIQVPVIDIRHFPQPQRDQEAERLTVMEAEARFNLSVLPLMRVSLLWMEEDDHMLLITIHHTVSDGWSIGVITNELGAIYEALTNGMDSPLPELPIQYADFTLWQNEWLEKNPLEAESSYWKQQLKNLPELDILTDRTRPAMQTHDGEIISTLLPRSLTDALRELSTRQNTTLFSTMLTAFNIMLSRYTGMEDIVVGTPIAGRNRVEVEPLIGVFINTLVLRADLSGDPTVLDLMTRVNETVLQAVANQEMPFEQLVDALRVKRDPSRNPLFQVNFAYQRDFIKPLHFSGITLTSIPSKSPGAILDLNFFLVERAEGWRSSCEYNTNLFDKATAMRMLGHFRALMETIATNPNLRLSELPMLALEEQQELLVDWNATALEYPRTKCTHDLVEAVAARTPDAVAVEFEGKRLSYQQLNSRANRLAWHLRALEVGPDTLVGLFMERSLEMVIGLLAVFKAGGAYVPLDPNYPEERLDFVLRDARAKVLLTQEQLRNQLPQAAREEQAGGPVILCLDSELSSVSVEDETNLPAVATPENLAYVLYTSGSTGKPKGVQIPHRALVNFLASVAQEPGLDASDVLLAVTTLSFDIAGLELWLPLTTGARVVIARSETVMDGRRLAAQLLQCGATVMQATPATWRLLLEAGWTGHRGLKILCGGEAWSEALARELLPRCGSLWNMYGPTETTIWSAVGRVELGESPLIGPPIANTQLYVLDKQARPVPVGVPGELHIGGDGLARGYLNRPELTAERFIVDLFSQQPGAKLYKTGDLVRYRANGKIEFLGRMDHQVKIRGFRIELGEIESMLIKHSAVHQAVVVAREESPGNYRLIAYLVAKPGMTVMTGELRDHLKSSLPEYMVPSAFAILPSLPLTPNGKIDRKALPAVEQDRALLERPFVATRTDTEKALAGIWCGVLRIERVGIHDNFFELGGHSLLATQVISRIRNVLLLEVPLRTLFQHPTVAELGAVIDADVSAHPQVVETPIPRINREVEMPLSFAQQRLWFLEQLVPNTATYVIRQGVRLAGPLDVNALARSLNEIVRRHEALRTIFPIVRGQPMQKILPSVNIEMPVIDLSGMPKEEREDEADRIARAEAKIPLDLRKGPILRAKLLRLGEWEHILLIYVHHIASDGWSCEVMLWELSTLYVAFLAGQPSPLEDLPVQYGDFAAWQREWLHGGVMAEQLAYWKKQFQDAPPLCSLPTDFPRPEVSTYRGALELVAIKKPLVESFKALCQSEGCTLFMGLLAAFGAVVNRHASQNDVVIGSPIANRNRTEIEGLIGCFLNTLVLRTDFSGSPSFRQILRRAREVTLEAYAHQDLPFEELVKELELKRDRSHSPLFQIMFILQNAPVAVAASGNLILSPFEVDNGTTKFDVTLALTEGPSGLNGTIEYTVDLFKPETMRRLIGHLEQLLAGAVANPDERISRLPLLTHAERQQVLVDWNQSQVEYPRERCVHQLFEEQAGRTPHAPAVVFEGQQLTYRGLNERANQLAHHLRRCGLGPNVLVGISVERSLEMMTGILGILKAGGAYVPLDPAYPQERLAYMLHDAKTPVLLTQKRVAEKLSAIDTRVLCLDSDWETIGQESRENPVGGATPDDLVYVIYTSGSTGRPKATGVYHRGFTNLTHWWVTDYAVAAEDRALMVGSLSFDLTQKGIHGPLLRGAQLHILPPGPYDPKLIGRMVEENRITIINCTPSTFYPLVDPPSPQALQKVASLRCITVGGEPISIPRLRPWLESKTCHAEVANNYGPTECTDISAAYRMNRENIDEYPFFPIGRPIYNAQLIIVNEDMQPCPIGVSGELCIAGDGVGAGYLNNPELTATKFIPNPFPEIAGKRIYKTGDLARYLPDGNIDFLGRIDQQVKIRGFRIELGEIEAALRSHSSVREAVVMAREQGADDKILAAYLVAQSGASIRLDDIFAHLKNRLPDYMVPASFQVLEVLPLTPSGKVDKRALPMPEKLHTAPLQKRDRPSSPVEEVLAGIWMELLNLKQIGIHDNFFELGGNSLLTIQVIDRVNRAGLNFTPAQIFRHQTIAGLAAVVATSQAVESPEAMWSSLVTLQPHGSKPPFYLVHTLPGDVLGYMRLVYYLGQDQPCYGFQSLGLNRKEESHKTLPEMAAHYVKLLRGFQPEGPYYLGGWCFGGNVALEMAHQLKAQGQEVALLALLETWAHPPPRAFWRFHLHRMWCVARLGPRTLAHQFKKRFIGRFQARKRVTDELDEFDFGNTQEGPLKNREFVYRVNLAATNQYQSRFYPGKVTLINGFSPESSHSVPLESRFKTLAAGTEVHRIPGGHRSVIQEPSVRQLADKLKSALTEAQRASGSGSNKSQGGA